MDCLNIFKKDRELKSYLKSKLSPDFKSFEFGFVTLFKDLKRNNISVFEIESFYLIGNVNYKADILFSIINNIKNEELAKIDFVKEFDVNQNYINIYGFSHNKCAYIIIHPSFVQDPEFNKKMEIIEVSKVYLDTIKEKKNILL